MEKKEIGLDEVLRIYGQPHESIIGKLPRGNTQLDFVGHADVTKMLLEVDPYWTWEPVAFDSDGLPAFRVENGMAHMGGWMTVKGVRRFGIGSCLPNKQDLLKELASDFIRNAAMRFGFCLSLWTKQEWNDLDRPVSVEGPKPKNKLMPAKPKPYNPNGENPHVSMPSEPKEVNSKMKPLSEEQIKQFTDACQAKGIDPKTVAVNAGIDEGRKWVEGDLAALRAAFKELVQFKEGN